MGKLQYNSVITFSMIGAVVKTDHQKTLRMVKETETEREAKTGMETEAEIEIEKEAEIGTEAEIEVGTEIETGTDREGEVILIKRDAKEIDTMGKRDSAL